MWIEKTRRHTDRQNSAHAHIEEGGGSRRNRHTSTLQCARHTIAATIVNAHTEYVIANMQSAFATRGKADVELAWWHANNFPMHEFTNTFDDVIDTAVATDAIGSGTDSLALCGGVDA